MITTNIYYQVFNKNNEELSLDWYYKSKKYKTQSGAIRNLIDLKTKADRNLNFMMKSVKYTFEQIEFVKSVIIELNLCKIVQIEEICTIKSIVSI